MKLVQILEFLTFVARKVMFWKNKKKSDKQTKEADNHEK